MAGFSPLDPEHARGSDFWDALLHVQEKGLARASELIFRQKPARSEKMQFACMFELELWPAFAVEVRQSPPALAHAHALFLKGLKTPQGRQADF